MKINIVVIGIFIRERERRRGLRLRREAKGRYKKKLGPLFSEKGIHHLHLNSLCSHQWLTIRNPASPPFGPPSSPLLMAVPPVCSPPASFNPLIWSRYSTSIKCQCPYLQFLLAASNLYLLLPFLLGQNSTWSRIRWPCHKNHA